VALDELVPERGERVAKQALIVGLRHDDPWHGRLVACAADTPFADGWLTREHAAHRRLVDVLVDEATSSERLVLAGAPIARPEPLPALPAAQRLLWRALCAGLPALALALIALVGGWRGRRVFQGESATGGRLGQSLRMVAQGAGAVLLALLCARAAAATGLELDATARGTNSLAPGTRAIAARSGEQGEVEVELFLSERSRLPPELRTPAARVAEVLADLEQAGARLVVRRRVPEDLGEAERAGLAARGVVPIQSASTSEELTRVTRFFAYMRLARGGQECLLAFPDARAFERLEYRLAFALARLAGARAPRVAFASDVPRLSAAEAYEQYQQKGLFAPRGSDVFARARETLELGDLEVTHVNPRAPVMPEGADVLVWLQPRRSIEAMLEETVRYLHGGGRVVLAAQHYNILPQQFRGGDFELQYWPRPQSCDLELLYFPELSIELVKEVLFDELALSIEAETQLTGRQGGRDFERQASALPFQIRASAANLVRDPDGGLDPRVASITADLGDQAFLWANRVRWDEAKLAQLGIRAGPLLTTSERTWSFAWKGGWVPHELLRGPAELEGSSGAGYLGRQPLAVYFEGQFPRPAGPLELNPSLPPANPAPPAKEEDPANQVAPAAPDAIGPGESGATPAAPPAPAVPAAPERPWPAPAPGKLVLLGCSEFLENERLADPAFRGDQLLWNAVAALAFDSEELRSVATRWQMSPGFGYVAPRARLAWRTIVIASGPALVVALAALVALARARPVRGQGARP
jgi:hypothetical protein